MRMVRKTVSTKVTAQVRAEREEHDLEIATAVECAFSEAGEKHYLKVLMMNDGRMRYLNSTCELDHALDAVGRLGGDTCTMAAEAVRTAIKTGASIYSVEDMAHFPKRFKAVYQMMEDRKRKLKENILSHRADPLVREPRVDPVNKVVTPLTRFHFVSDMMAKQATKAAGVVVQVFSDDKTRERRMGFPDIGPQGYPQYAFAIQDPDSGDWRMKEDVLIAESKGAFTKDNRCLVCNMVFSKSPSAHTKRRKHANAVIEAARRAVRAVRPSRKTQMFFRTERR